MILTATAPPTLDSYIYTLPLVFLQRAVLRSENVLSIAVQAESYPTDL